MTIFGKEPAVIIGLVGGAIIAAVQVLGPELFPDVQEVVIQAVQAIVAVLSVIAIRTQVYAPATYERDIAAASGDGADRGGQ